MSVEFFAWGHDELAGGVPATQAADLATVDFDVERVGTPASGIARAKQTAAGLQRPAPLLQHFRLERIGMEIVKVVGVVHCRRTVVENIDQRPASVRKMHRSRAEPIQTIGQPQPLRKPPRVIPPNLPRRVVDKLTLATRQRRYSIRIWERWSFCGPYFWGGNGPRE